MAPRLLLLLLLLLLCLVLLPLCHFVYVNIAFVIFRSAIVSEIYLVVVVVVVSMFFSFAVGCMIILYVVCTGCVIGLMVVVPAYYY